MRPRRLVLESVHCLFSAGLDYLDCLERALTTECDAHTAAWQRKFTRLTMSELFTDNTCSSIFGKYLNQRLHVNQTRVAFMLFKFLK